MFQRNLISNIELRCTGYEDTTLTIDDMLKYFGYTRLNTLLKLISPVFFFFTSSV
jgi:hypothetical protein